jgi:hypothetical protein
MTVPSTLSIEPTYRVLLGDVDQFRILQVGCGGTGSALALALGGLAYHARQKGIQVELSSGILPPNTLFWQQQANQYRLGIYVPARRWRIQTDERRYHLPMPPFVFVGGGTAYQIFAVKKRPLDARACLYHAPCPNVHTHGSICQGNTPFPTAAPGNIHTALTLFMEGSLFNADLSQGKCQTCPDDVRQLWVELDGRKRFPLSELMPTQMLLRQLM